MGAIPCQEILAGMFGRMSMPPQDDVSAALRSLLLAHEAWVKERLADVREDECRADRILFTAGVYSRSRPSRIAIVHSLRRRVGLVTPLLMRLCADILLDHVNSPGAVLRVRIRRIHQGSAPITYSRDGWSTEEMITALRLMP